MIAIDWFLSIATVVGSIVLGFFLLCVVFWLACVLRERYVEWRIRTSIKVDEFELIGDWRQHQDWLEERFGPDREAGRWCRYGCYYCFRHARDAVYFKMNWT